MTTAEIPVLFIYADGTREWRNADPSREWWRVPKREPFEPRSSLLGDCPPVMQHGTILTFRRERHWYADDWSGPLESWWRWDKRTVYEERPPTRPWPAHWPQPPSTVPQRWPVEKPIRVEYRFVEEVGSSR